MIIFHEGLSRSGKSYEAVVNRIIPALLSGRQVFAYIEGLNHEKFAQVTELPLERVQELLHQIEDSQVATIYDHVENDSLVIIDELQDYFPSGRQKISQPMTKFITQHGHRGIDIIAMGQAHKDCHNLWRRRIDQLITFVKLDSVGMENSYSWTTYKQVNEKFQKLLSGTSSYDSKYFGLYKSHTDETLNKGNYQDKRANFLNSKMLRYGVPVTVIGAIAGVVFLWNFFTTTPIKEKQGQPKQETSQPADSKTTKLASDTTKQPEKRREHIEGDDYLKKYLEDYRPRLSAYIHNARKFSAIVDFLDESNRVNERLNIPAILAFGYSVQQKPFGLLLISPKGEQYVVTPYPLDKVKGASPMLQAKN